MKLTAELTGEKHTLNVKRDGAHAIVEIDGRGYEMEVREPEPGVYLLLAGGRVYECHVVRGTAARRDAFVVHVGTATYSLTLTDPKQLRSTAQSGDEADATAQIIAPMPGKVVRVLVEVGAQVEAGDGLIVVEAMKMQNEMKSPRAGTVTALYAKTGATVNAGDVLVVVE